MSVKAQKSITTPATGLRPNEALMLLVSRKSTQINIRISESLLRSVRTKLHEENRLLPKKEHKTLTDIVISAIEEYVGVENDVESL